MKRRTRRTGLIVPIVVLLSVLLGSGGRADTPLVRAVVFYSPNCGHRHKVITEDLQSRLSGSGVWCNASLRTLRHAFAGLQARHEAAGVRSFGWPSPTRMTSARQQLQNANETIRR
jgi:hypothetical protein